MSFRFYSSIILLAVAVTLSFSFQAQANTGGTSGAVGNTAAPGGGGGAGGGAGPIPYQELYNTEVGNISLPNGVSNTFEQIRETQARLKANGGQVNSQTGTRNATSALLSALNCNNRANDNTYSPQPNRCPLWYQENKTIGWNTPGAFQKLHYRSFGSSDQMSTGITIAFNLKVWRERPDTGVLELIFQRRVGVPGSARRAQLRARGIGQYRTSAPLFPFTSIPADLSNRMGWWQGHTDRTYWVSGADKAGPFGGGAPAGKACQNRPGNGTRTDTKGNRVSSGIVGSRLFQESRTNNFWCYWEGAEIGDKYFRWGSTSGTTNYLRGKGRPGNLPNDQFGKGKAGFEDKGLKEAIYFAWNLDQYKPRGRPTYNLRVEGAPGVFYMAQVVAIDNRQKIMPFAKTQDFGYAINNGQMVRVWTATPNPCVGICDPPPPQRYPYDPNTPEPVIKLNTQSPLQTRENSVQEVALVSDESQDMTYDHDQAVFPYESSIAHYTPQLRFSSITGKNAGGGTYGTNYIQYTNAPTGTVKRENVSAAAWNPAQTKILSPSTSSNSNVQVAKITEANSLDLEADGGMTPYSSSEYNLTWLQPTLSSPCPVPGSAGFGYAASSTSDFNFKWPRDMTKCEFDADVTDLNQSIKGDESYQPPVDVWNDTLSASGSWEERWVERLANDLVRPYAPGQVPLSTIRCADYNNKFSLGKRADNCNHPFYGLVPGAINSADQNAQGSIVIDSNSSDKRAPVRIILDTNFNNNTQGDLSAEIRRRGTGVRIGITPGTNLINTVSLNPELNYCTQGIRNGTRVQFGSGSSATYRFDSAWLGDEGCRGYTIRWAWNQTDNFCNAVNPNGTNGVGTRPSNDLIKSNSGLTGLGPSNFTRPSGYIAYGNRELEGTRRTAYPSNVNSVPFSGNIPGSAENSYQSCQERNSSNQLRNGFRTKGEWVIDSEAQPGWGLNNAGDAIYHGSDEPEDNVLVATFNFRLNDPNILLTGIPTPNESFNSNPANMGPGRSCPAFQGRPVKICWAMRSTYGGYPNLVWHRRWGEQRLFEGGNGDTLATESIQVFGPKASR